MGVRVVGVQPLHVSARIERQTREHVAPTVKLRLTALRHLFDPPCCATILLKRISSPSPGVRALLNEPKWPSFCTRRGPGTGLLTRVPQAWESQLPRGERRL